MADQDFPGVVTGEGYAVAPLDGARRGLRLSQGASRPRRHRLRGQRDRASARLRDRAVTSTSARRRPTSSTAGRSRSSSGTAASTASAPAGSRGSTRPRSACCATSATRTPSYLCVGGEDGYVGRDGRLPDEDEPRARPSRPPGAADGAGVRRGRPAHPGYPAADGYQLPAEVAHLASNESPFAAAAPGGRGRRAGRRGREPLSRPDQRPAARARSPTATACPAAHRDRQRLVRRPAGRRRGAARARRRGRLRVAVVLMYPHLAAATGARRSSVPLDDDDRHDLDAMAERDHRRHAAW